MAQHEDMPAAGRESRRRSHEFKSSSEQGTSRRTFVKGTAVVRPALARLSMPSGALLPGERLKVGLVGAAAAAGAASQAISGDPGVLLWSMGDVYADRLRRTSADSSSSTRTGMVVPGRQFVGPDAIDNVLDSGVDVVILATPPDCPDHLEKAVNAGKHVFCEKPMATDMPVFAA